MIMNAICPLAQVSVRIEPSDKSEMVTQLLFGETFSILEEKGNWFLIHTHVDDYQGWIDRKQSLEISNEFADKIKHSLTHVLADKTAVCYCKNDSTYILLGKGCQLPLLANNAFHLGERVYTTTAKCKSIPKKFNAAKTAESAIDYLNTPYLWGGRSTSGIDCSGLVQVVYNMHGCKLPRDAAQQANFGEVIDFIDEVIPGDLAFFDNPMGEIIHVGIIVAAGKILHASGHVRIDNIDHNGIFNTEKGAYTHSLRILKRL